MAKRQSQFDDYIGVPVTKAMKKRIKREAEGRERNLTETARILIRERLDEIDQVVPADAEERKLEAAAK